MPILLAHGAGKPLPLRETPDLDMKIVMVVKRLVRDINFCVIVAQSEVIVSYEELKRSNAGAAGRVTEIIRIPAIHATRSSRRQHAFSTTPDVDAALKSSLPAL